MFLSIGRSAFLLPPGLKRTFLLSPRHPFLTSIQRRPYTISTQSKRFLMSSTPSTGEILTPREAHERSKLASWKFLDVRTLEEYTMGHPPGSICVPFMNKAADGSMQKNESFVAEVQDELGMNRNSERKIVVSCGSGKRSKLACEVLREKGWTVADVDGGFGEWVKDESLPVEKGGVNK